MLYIISISGKNRLFYEIAYVTYNEGKLLR